VLHGHFRLHFDVSLSSDFAKAKWHSNLCFNTKMSIVIMIITYLKALLIQNRRFNILYIKVHQFSRHQWSLGPFSSVNCFKTLLTSADVQELSDCVWLALISILKE
jgi:hypothetical protein